MPGTIGEWAQMVIAVTSFLAFAVGIWNNRNIRKIEIATNSMKDALVRTTGENEHAKGVIAGAAEEKARH